MRFSSNEKVTEAKIRRLSNSIAPSFTIHKVGSTYYAEANYDGGTDHEETTAAAAIQAAHDDLTTGGMIFVKAGDYDIDTVITVTNDYIHLTGEGWATKLKASADVGVIQAEGVDATHWLDNFILSNLHVEGYSAGGASGVRLYQYVKNSLVENVWVDKCGYDAILLQKFAHHCAVQNCVVQGGGSTGDDGINLYDDVRYCSVVGNLVEGIKVDGIHISEDAADWGTYGNTIASNTVEGCGDDGIMALNILECVFANNTSSGNTKEGLRFQGSKKLVIDGNVCRNNTDNGILAYPSFGESVITNNICASNTTYDGIRLYQTDRCLVQGNSCIDNGRYGIYIQDAAAEDNKVISNILSGNTTAQFEDTGTRTIIEKLVLPFVDGTTFLSADGAAWGWEIDANTEYAIATGTLPPGIQQIEKITVKAVSIVLEADAMRLEINGYAGVSNEAFNQETIAVADKASSTTNFAANDYVYWQLTSADDADIGHLAGGDTVMFKVLHEAAGGDDCATDAVFQAVIIEYV